ASYAAFTFSLRHWWTYFLRTLPDIADLEPLECAINEVLIPAVTVHTVTKVERDLLGLPVRMGGLGFTDPVETSSSEYEASIKVTNPLVRRIVEQEHQPPDASESRTLQLSTRKQKDDCLSERLEQVKNSLPTESKRAVDVDHAMVCQGGGFIIQRHNELLDLEAEMLKMVCNDVEVEPVLRETERSAFFDVRVCHPNADSYRDLTPKQIYKKHENEKKRQYAERVMEIEQGTFTPLVFTITGGIADDCVKYHGRLAELIANKKGESYLIAISWIRAKVSFAIVRSAILCLRDSRSRGRQLDFVDSDPQIENIRACPN
ncbi:unnamed protein product, partial [Porites lobata]